MVNEWINDNYDTIKGWLHNIIKDESQSVQEDLLHDILLSFMEHPRVEEIIENGEARWFLVRMTLNQSRSSTSRHFKIYKKYNYEFIENITETEEEEYDIIKDMEIETLLNCLDEMYKGNNRERYYAMIILLYMTLENFSEVSRRTGIPRTTVSMNYKEGLVILKEKYLNEKNNNIEKDNKTLKILNTQILKDYGREKLS